jgi:hypothetical protein
MKVQTYTKKLNFRVSLQKTNHIFSYLLINFLLTTAFST